MSKKTRQFVAIVALIFMAGFIVFGMMYLLDKSLLNGAVGFGALFCGAFAFVLYFVIVFDNKFGEEGTKKRMEEAQKAEEEARKRYEEEKAKERSEAPGEQTGERTEEEQERSRRYEEQREEDENQ